MWTVTAMWGARAESATDCATRLVTWLNSASEINPGYREWRPVAATKSAAEASQPLRTIGEWAAALEAGAIAPGLGMVASAWVGETKIVVHAGGSSAISNNLFLLNIADSDVDSLLEPATATALLTATATAWEPDMAQVTNPTLTAEHRPEPDGFLPGWLTYLPATSPHYVRTQKFARYRTLPRAQGEIFALTPDHHQFEATKLDGW